VGIDLYAYGGGAGGAEFAAEARRFLPRELSAETGGELVGKGEGADGRHL